MNKLKVTKVDYLRPNRTYETVLVSNGIYTKDFFVYNYEGVHFRVFENVMDMYNSVDGDTNTKIIAEFEREGELDNFLEMVLKI